MGENNRIKLQKGGMIQAVVLQARVRQDYNKVQGLSQIKRDQNPWKGLNKDLNIFKVQELRCSFFLPPQPYCLKKTSWGRINKYPQTAGEATEPAKAASTEQPDCGRASSSWCFSAACSESLSHCSFLSWTCNSTPACSSLQHRCLLSLKVLSQHFLTNQPNKNYLNSLISSITYC